jgi:hypothetical protein
MMPNQRQRNYSWAFPKPYLVQGHKGSHWCYAKGSRNAQTVYRRIPPATPRGTALVVSTVRLNRLADLQQGTEFWMLINGNARSFRVEKRIDMVHTAELPFPGEPEFEKWYGG